MWSWGESVTALAGRATHNSCTAEQHPNNALTLLPSPCFGITTASPVLSCGAEITDKYPHHPSHPPPADTLTSSELNYSQQQQF